MSAANLKVASLYVGDLDPDVNEAMLFETFKEMGPVLSIRVCRDAVTRRSLGYAYVNFQNTADAERCIDAFNFFKFKERPCRIMWSQRNPALRKNAKSNIFIKNLHSSIDNKSLHDTFSVFGNILSCKAMTNDKGESLGYGFVHFETEEAATSAIDKVNGMLLQGKQVFVGPFIRRSARISERLDKFTNVYVKHIKTTISEEELIKLFSECGEITSAFIVKKDDQSRGFGFVNFKEHESAVNAINKFHDLDSSRSPAVQEGKSLYVQRHQKKRERAHLREQALKERQIKWSQYVNLYVKNLDDGISDERLRQKFSEYGEVLSARVMKDENGASKGFGFVSFKEPEAANKALELNGNIGFSNKPLYVGIAQRKEYRRIQLEATFSRGLPFQVAGGRTGPQPTGFYQQNQIYPVAPPQQGQFRGPAGPKFGFPPQMSPAARGAFPTTFPVQQRGPGLAAPRGPPTVAPPRGAAMQMPRGIPIVQTIARGMMQPIIQPKVAPAMVSVGYPKRIIDPSANEMDSLQATLAQMSPEAQKNALGEKLFTKISQKYPELAAKITGMLLEMDNSEILNLLESPAHLDGKVNEAIHVLQTHPEEM